MKKLTLDDLPDEGFVNTRVYLDKKYILLTPDIPVTMEMKNRLRRWNFTSLMIFDNSDSDDNAPATVTTTQNETVQTENIHEQQLRQEAATYYSDCLAFLIKIVKSLQPIGLVHHPNVNEKVKDMQAQLRSHRRFMLNPPPEVFEGINYNISHSVRTAFLTLSLAEILKLSLHRQIEAGMAALLHRIGIFRLPPELYMAKRNLTPQEKQPLHTYPVISFQILKSSGFPMNVASAVLEHQERIDGSGYPRQLTGHDISLEGKIIGVTNAYSAIVAQRPHTEGKNSHTAMVEIIEGSGKIYDQATVKALILALSSTGSQGKSPTDQEAGGSQNRTSSSPTSI